MHNLLSALAQPKWQRISISHFPLAANFKVLEVGLADPVLSSKH